jgi:DHA2 family multidrug resistance protein
MNVIDPASADRLGGLGEAAMQVMNLEINRQAAMIAYLDDFQLMMIVLVVISPLIFFLKPGTAAPGQQPAMAE